ncbi:DUF1848 family protein, partial [Thermodesulfobacteriota bacterium]
FLEPRVPDLSHTMRMVERLARRFSPSILRWRYDTIVITRELDRSWHMRNFAELCRMLAAYSSECIFSFCDYYKKTIKNMEAYVPSHEKPQERECREIAKEMALIANDNGIAMTSCSHDFLVSDSIAKARCIDPSWVLKVVDTPDSMKALAALRKVPSRKECGCFASKDIGAYDTCAHGCVYCYANTNPEAGRKNLALISQKDACLDPKSARSEGRS